jgi:hypothetical protein
LGDLYKHLRAQTMNHKELITGCESVGVNYGGTTQHGIT